MAFRTGRQGATFAGRRPRERYHRTGAELSQILTNYDVVPWAAPGATCPQKGGGLSAPPALGPFCWTLATIRTPCPEQWFG
jgi:hypothetical protein